MRGEAPFLPTVSDFLQLYLCETYRANFDESKQDIKFCSDQSLVEFDTFLRKSGRIDLLQEISKHQKITTIQTKNRTYST